MPSLARWCYVTVGNAANGALMIANAAEEQERKVAHATLVRLANSCERAAARGRSVTPMAADLDEEDYRTIADILRRMADMVER